MQVYILLFIANHSLSQPNINKCIIFLFTAIYIVCSGEGYSATRTELSRASPCGWIYVSYLWVCGLSGHNISLTMDHSGLHTPCTLNT
jgi:hypothetical protein